MTPAHQSILRTTAFAAALLALPIALITLPDLLLHKEVWTRDHPLTDPIAVTEVAGGVLILADGRTLRPAGIPRTEGVTPTTTTAPSAPVPPQASWRPQRARLAGTFCRTLRGP